MFEYDPHKFNNSLIKLLKKRGNRLFARRIDSAPQTLTDIGLIENLRKVYTDPKIGELTESSFRINRHHRKNLFKNTTIPGDVEFDPTVSFKNYHSLNQNTLSHELGHGEEEPYSPSKSTKFWDLFKNRLKPENYEYGKEVLASRRGKKILKGLGADKLDVDEYLSAQERERALDTYGRRGVPSILQRLGKFYMNHFSDRRTWH